MKGRRVLARAVESTDVDMQDSALGPGSAREVIDRLGGRDVAADGSPASTSLGEDVQTGHLREGHELLDPRPQHGTASNRNDLGRTTHMTGLQTAPDGVAVQSIRNMLTTSQAARMAGVSQSTIVRRRAELGAVPSPSGFLVDETILRTKITTLRHRLVGSSAPADGAIAAAVFAAFKEAEDARDIVIRLSVAPALVRELRKEWDEMAKLRPLNRQMRTMYGRDQQFRDGQWVNLTAWMVPDGDGLGLTRTLLPEDETPPPGSQVPRDLPSMTFPAGSGGVRSK